MSDRATTAAEEVLVVEDDRALGQLLEEELTEAGYATAAVRDVEAAWTHIADRPPLLVISDLRLPGDDGMALLQRIKSLPVRPGFIVITAFGTIEQAVQALKRGADDFLTKPLDLEHLRLSVQRVLETRGLRQQLERYRQILGQEHLHGIVGRSAPMRELLGNIQRVARAGGAVLIGGESGVGKELVARAIHAESERRDGPFVAINSAALPRELLESELFGHEAGAFTGAQRARAGLLREAHGGTLLLDEIGDMPLEMQAKLLRVLEGGGVRPLGASQEHAVDVRIIAATNRDLEAEVRAGGFRADLFYRLETFALRVPPLRERGDDRELLAAHFLRRHSEALGQPCRGFSRDALAALRAYGFPGNVRELANAVERAATFCRGSEIVPEDLPERIRAMTTAAQSGIGLELIDGSEPLPHLQELQRRYVAHVLGRVGGNKRRAAEILGIGRRTLYRYLGHD